LGQCHALTRRPGNVFCDPHRSRHNPCRANWSDSCLAASGSAV
jgi:hypothetical protein